MNQNLIPCQCRALLWRVLARCMILLLVLMLGAAPSAMAQWNVTTNDGAITVNGYSNTVAGELVIPAIINGLPVRTIGPWAFYLRTELTSVVIPDTVTSLEGLGWGPYGPFWACTALTNVTFGSNVTNIGCGAFRGCTSLVNVTLPQRLVTVGFRSFSGCSNLARIHITKNVSSIEPEAFSGCTGLTEITVDPLNGFYSSIDGVLFDRSQTSLLQYPSARAGAYVIPDNVHAITEGAFEECAHLTSLSLPAGLSTIAPGNFFGCGSSLVSIDVDPANTSYASADGVLFDKSQTTLIRFPAARGGTYTIPQGVQSIARDAFQGCAILTGISVPSTVKSIEWRAFWDCVSLGSVTLPNSVTNLGGAAFRGCTSLTNVAVLGRLERLPDGLFENCTSLSSISLPEGPTWIGDGGGDGDWSFIGGTFQNCSSLRSIQLPRSVVRLFDKAFAGCSNLLAITLPTNLVGISGEAFARSGLTKIVIPDKVEGIGLRAFAGCPNLREISVGAANPTYSSVDGMLFNKSCTVLVQCPGATATCTLPNTVTSIDYCAFSGCVNLTNITIPNSVVYIGEAAFEDCASLEAVALPSTLTYLPTQLFSGCTSLRRITIPQRVTRLEQVVFEGCSNLTGVYFEGNAPSVDPNAFWQSPRFTLYYLPNTAGWGKTLGGLPTALWLPQVLSPGFAIGTNAFGFRIAWASGRRVVIQACTELSNPVWTPLQSQVISNGAAYFSDTNTTTYPQRFYRVRW